MSASASSDGAVDDPDIAANDASSILRSWGVDIDASELPIVTLPEPIVYLIAKRKWDYVWLLTDWHRAVVNGNGKRFTSQPLFAELAWPPPDSPSWAAGRASDTIEEVVQPAVAEMEANELRTIADNIRGWSVSILDSIPDEDIPSRNAGTRGISLGPRIPLWAFPR